MSAWRTAEIELSEVPSAGAGVGSAVSSDGESPQAYLAASQYLIDHCDLLLAVWGGSTTTGNGGTADAVAYARERGRSTMVVWPDGAQRS